MIFRVIIHRQYQNSRTFQRFSHLLKDFKTVFRRNIDVQNEQIGTLQFQQTEQFISRIRDAEYVEMVSVGGLEQEFQALNKKLMVVGDDDVQDFGFSFFSSHRKDFFNFSQTVLAVRWFTEFIGQ